MSFGGPDKPNACDHDHRDADGNEGEARGVGKHLAVRRGLLLRHLRHREFQEQVEPLDQESECHHRNGGADPGEKSSLVGGMVAVAFDHWTAPMMCRRAL